MISKQLLIGLSFFAAVSLQAQDSLVLEKSIPANAGMFTTDALSNLYWLNTKGEVIKYQWTDGRTFTYSNKQLGQPAWVDASNPMQVLVLYPDVQSVVLLDSRMGQINLIKLLATSDGHSYLPLAACAQPEDDFFWIYDGLAQQLIKLDERGNTVAMSEPFTSMFDFTVVKPSLYYQEQTLFLADSDRGLLIFDRYGSFVKANDITRQTLLQIDKENYYFLEDGQLHIIHRQLYGSDAVSLPVENARQVRVLAGKVFVLTPDAIEVYRIRE